MRELQNKEMERLKKLSEMGDPLEKVSEAINWEMFRPILNEVYQKKEQGVGGRPPWDYVLMFKILLLQEWYAIADDKIEYFIFLYWIYFCTFIVSKYN